MSVNATASLPRSECSEILMREWSYVCVCVVCVLSLCGMWACVTAGGGVLRAQSIVMTFLSEGVQIWNPQMK